MAIFYRRFSFLEPFGTILVSWPSREAVRYHVGEICLNLTPWSTAQFQDFRAVEFLPARRRSDTIVPSNTKIDLSLLKYMLPDDAER